MSTEQTPNDLSVEIEDDFAGLTEGQVEEERKLMAERAERVRRRLTMNRAFLPTTARSAARSKKKPHVS